MDGHLLQQIQRELQAFEDRQLIALMELTVAELMERGILEPPGPPPEAPDTGNRGALDELDAEADAYGYEDASTVEGESGGDERSAP